MRATASTIVWPVTPGIGFSLAAYTSATKTRVAPFECRAKFMLQCLRARVTVRLEHHHDALRADGARGVERRLDLAGVMPVIVHDHVIVAAVFHLEPPLRAAEGLERLGDFINADAQHRGQRNHAGGVGDIVPAGDIQREIAEPFLVAEHLELRVEAARQHGLEAELRANRVSPKEIALARPVQMRAACGSSTQ